MPGISIEERLLAGGVQIPDDGQAVSGAAAGGAGDAPAAAPPLPPVFDRIRAFLSRRSPAKKVEDYRDHPLNWRKDPDGQDAAGQIIRGMEGFAGGLDYAVIDLALGWIKLQAVNRKGAAAGG